MYGRNSYGLRGVGITKKTAIGKPPSLVSRTPSTYECNLPENNRVYLDARQKVGAFIEILKVNSSTVLPRCPGPR